MSPKSIKHNRIVRFVTKPARLLIKCISPRKYIALEYHYVTGHKLNLKDPTRYTEKLQYLRLYAYPNNKLVAKCTSREGLREYSKNLGLESNLIKIYGFFNDFDDINFDSLPKQFVIKCTHASSFNYICYDKSKINIKKLKRQFNKWLKTDYGKLTCEPHYSNIQPKLIIEELLLENNNLPTEYKIHVFNGKARYLYVVTDRGKDIHYNNYLINWQEFDRAQFNHWTKSNNQINKPLLWNEMINVAEKLASPFPFVRVDLYYINKKIYISEMTFTPAKGTLTFADDNVDIEMGEWLNLSK